MQRGCFVGLLFFLVFSALGSSHTCVVTFKPLAGFKLNPEAIPVQCKLKTIECHATYSALEQEIMALLDLPVGSDVTRERVIKGIERLARKERFTQVTLEFVQDDNDGSKLCVTAECNWTIRSVKLEGVVSSKDEYLNRYELASGDPFVLEKHVASCNNIKTYAQELGYKDARVSGHLVYDHRTMTVAIRLIIARGKRSPVEKEAASEKKELPRFFFKGNDFISQEELQKKCDDITDVEAPVPSLVIAQELEAFYHEKGFLQVRVEAVKDLEQQTSFVIQEGHRSPLPEKKVPLPVLDLDEQKKSEPADGFRFVFGKTITKGYTKIPYDRILKLLSYEEGQAWNKEEIKQSLNYLRSLGVFERIMMTPVFTKEESGRRDLLLKLKDDDPFEIKMRFGFAQVSTNHLTFKQGGATYKFGSSLIWKNPSARADKVLVEADFNRFEHRFSTAYKTPLLGEHVVATTLKAYDNKYIQPIYYGSPKPLYQVIQQGFLVGFSKHYPHCDFTVGTGFDWMEIDDITLGAAHAIGFEPSLIDKKIPYLFVEPMVYVDFLNDKINPSKGFFSMLALKGLFPFKKSSYVIKLLGEQGIFIPLAKTVFAMRFRAGHIFGADFAAIMPSERFYLGGPNSIRAYLQDYCPPLGAYVTDEGTIQEVPRGGKTMFNANFELRFPLSKQLIYGTVFQDFGILVGRHEELFEPGVRPLAATGFGIRYMTPVGPLRFDIGWKWKKDTPEASSYAWYLTFGNAF